MKRSALALPRATNAALLWKQHVDFPLRPPALPYSTGSTTTVPGTHRGLSHQLLTKYLGPNLKLWVKDTNLGNLGTTAGKLFYFSNGTYEKIPIQLTKVSMQIVLP